MVVSEVAAILGFHLCLRDSPGVSRVRLSGYAGLPGSSTAERERAMQPATAPSTTAHAPAAGWLVENGPKELQLLFRSIVSHPSTPVLTTDDDGNSTKAMAGA